MKAAQIVAHQQPLEIAQVADPKIGPTDALVRIEAEGICRTDWHTWNGDWDWVGFLPPLPVIPGHEFSGTVVDVGSDVQQVRIGDRVTVPFAEGCGRCANCGRGRTNLCLNINVPGFTHSGGYAELVAVPTADVNCIGLPEVLDFTDAAALGCRYMTSYNAVVVNGRARPGQWVLVYGAGGMGLAAVQIAAAVGCFVIAVDIYDAKLTKATAEGAAAVINSSATTNVPEAVKEISGGGVDLSIDATTRPGTTAQCVLSLRHGGRHVQAGMTSSDQSGMIPLPVDLMLVLEVEFTGAMGLARADYPEMLRQVAAGKLRPGSLVNERIPLEEASRVLKAMNTFDTVGINVITSF